MIEITVTQAAAILGLSLHHLTTMCIFHQLEPSGYTDGGHRRYDLDTVKAYRAKIVGTKYTGMIADVLLSNLEIRRSLHICKATMEKMLQDGTMPQPAMAIGPKVYWTKDQLAKMKKVAISQPPKGLTARETVYNLGFYTLLQAAEKIGTNYHTLQYWRTHNQIPQPTRRCELMPHLVFYNDEDVAEIKKLKAPYLLMKELDAKKEA